MPLTRKGGDRRLGLVKFLAVAVIGFRTCLPKPTPRLALVGVLGTALALSQSAQAQIGKANLIFIDRGFQVQGMVTRDDVFHLDTYTNASYTSVNWIWDSNPSLLGPAPGFPWSRWVHDETNMPGMGTHANELPYTNQLVSLQLADEWFLGDPAVRTRAINWFNSLSNSYPGTILYANNYGGQVGDSELIDFVSRGRPDMICFDYYPWRSDYATRIPINTPPTAWYSELRRYRDIARGGGIPFESYVQTFHAVQDYDQTVYRDPSGSELRLNHFAALAFNAKALIDFTYNTGASSLFTSPGGDSYPTQLLSEKTDCALRARNFGKALVRLKPVDEATTQWTTSIMFLRGKNSGGTPNPIPINFIADPEAPNTYTDWVYQRNDPYLNGFTVTNQAGVVNGGQIGDVIIAWFKPLDESFDSSDYSNEVYMMVVNGLADAGGTPADCMQEIKLNFVFGASGITGLVMLDPVTGQLQTNTLPTLPPPNTAKRQLVLDLNGGDAVLFKFANNAPFVGFYNSPAPRLTAKMQAGTPAITIRGTVGDRCDLQAAASLPVTNWTTLTSLLLPSTNYIFLDDSYSNAGDRFYRVVIRNR